MSSHRPSKKKPFFSSNPILFFEINPACARPNIASFPATPRGTEDFYVNVNYTILHSQRKFLQLFDAAAAVSHAIVRLHEMNGNVKRSNQSKPNNHHSKGIENIIKNSP
jgi:hypothetical protein